MDYFAALRAFARAVELGSFSKAATDLDMKVSTVSRHVSALEADLGAALFNRSTRALHLTEAGATFYGRIGAILEDLEEARQAASAFNAHPRGVLRLAIPGGFGRRHVLPHLKDFCAQYPEIGLDISTNESIVDLIDEGMDVAIRIGALPDSSLVARRLADNVRLLVASPDYLAAHGAPEAPEDLERHQCLAYAHQRRDDAWFHRPLDGAVDATPARFKSRFRANDADAMLHAARDGLGIGLLSTWLMADELRDGRLVPLMTNRQWTLSPGSPPAIYGVYPPKKTVSTKVRAFMDFMAQRIGSPPYWERANP